MRPQLVTDQQAEEEQRVRLQERLTLFASLLFWSFAALVVFLFAMYAAYPEITPGNQKLIYLVAAFAFVLLAGVWRVLGRPRSYALLQSLDLFIITGSGCVFGVVAALAWDLHASAYTCLLYQSFVVFTRALLIPTPARRTLVVSILAFVPIVIGATVLAIISAYYAPHDKQLEVPPIAFVAGCLLYNAVAVVLAWRGSDIIYTLREDVRRLGNYELRRRIDGGAMGDVYEARHVLLRRPTAVKLIRPDRLDERTIDRFEREVQMTSQLTHPNTIAIYDYGRRTVDGALYYAMEYLTGIDLQKLVADDRYGAQPSDRVVQILIQAASALAEAHAAGMIHRDIKPGNIILCERGLVPDFVKVVDFGLVKDNSEGGADLTQEAVIVGTPNYMAPESATRRQQVDARVDLYALGAVGFFLLTGRTVFQGATQMAVIAQHVSSPRPRFADVTDRVIPADLEAVILRCLAISPDDRPSSATELVEILEALPRAGNWTRDDATAWWAGYRARAPAAPLSDAPTETVEIDLASRIGVGS